MPWGGNGVMSIEQLTSYVFLTGLSILFAQRKVLDHFDIWGRYALLTVVAFSIVWVVSIIIRDMSDA